MKSLKYKARIAGQLSLPDWFALVEAWWLLLVSFLALWRMSYERVCGEAHPVHTECTSTADWVHRAQRLGRIVTWSSRLHFLPMTCLVRAVTLNRMLSRRAIQSRLCIGANKSLDRVHAHAWVEVQGQAISEPGDIGDKFHVLASGNLPDRPVK